MKAVTVAGTLWKATRRNSCCSEDCVAGLRTEGMVNELYETSITDKRWIAYDIPGNIGWIVFLVCLVLCLRDGITAFSAASAVPMALMLVGIGELISERVARLDRILPRKRLVRGFGALTFGGIVGVATSAIGIVLHLHGSLPLWMLIGAALCAVFAGLLYGGYRRREEQGERLVLS